MSTRSETAPKKLPYEKPRLRTVSLAAEEVLAAGCKLPVPPGGGFAPPNCATSKCIGPGS
jgi:hypothetical protein